MKRNNIINLLKQELKKRNIKIDNNKLNLIVQIITFVIVGGIATIIDFIIYYICYNLLKIDPLIANIISFSISVIYNFYASVKYVFDIDSNKSKKIVFIEFIILAIIGLLLSELLLFIFINKLGINKMISKVLATIIVMVFNFITRKILLEKKQDKHERKHSKKTN